MLAKNVQLGATYVMKISGKLAPVRITNEVSTTAYGTYASASIYGSRYGNPKVTRKFMGVNERTGRTVGPYTAAKLRWEVVRLNGKWVNPATAQAAKEGR